MSSIDRAKEYAAELLKERIYATLALLAVLISIDEKNTTAWHAGIVIVGTIVSLWVASLVAALMSRRVIYQGALDSEYERTRQLRKHAPMLATLPLPVFMLLLALANMVSLSVAINFSIASEVLLLIGWSVLSARAMKATRLPTIILVAAEFTIGLGVVLLKLAISH